MEKKHCPVVLVTSFGTSYVDNCEKTIGAIENDIRRALPLFEVRRAFTSYRVTSILKKRDGLIVDNVEQAMEKLAMEGVKEVYVQPTHVMNGYEYEKMAGIIEKYVGRFNELKIGVPLLNTEEDYIRVARALLEKNDYLFQPQTCLVFMGHGSEHEANEVYAKLERAMRQMGHTNVLIGTVEGYPDIDSITKTLTDQDYRHVVLLPLTIVAGDHATNDMAGDDDSWKSILSEKGYDVTCVLKGIGEYPEIRDIYVEHVRKLMGEKE